MQVYDSVQQYKFNLLTYAFHSGANDIFLVKYSSAGSVVWTRQAGTPWNDYGRGVAVSGDGLSIYVTGYTESNLNGQTYTGRHRLLQPL